MLARSASIIFRPRMELRPVLSTTFCATGSFFGPPTLERAAETIGVSTIPSIAGGTRSTLEATALLRAARSVSS